MEEQEYYISGEVSDSESERGPFVVICSRYIDGNIADVYGETMTEARRMAELIVDSLNNMVLIEDLDDDDIEYDDDGFEVGYQDRGPTETFGNE